MGKRRLERPRPLPGRRRQVRTRPRYGRLSAAGLSLLVTLVALLGGLGVLPKESPAAASAPQPDPVGSAATWAAARPTDTPTPTVAAPTPSATVAAKPAQRTPSKAAEPAALPRGTGSGKRVVFDISAQRMWLVRENDTVARTYLVSGSVTDNLRPGSYAVYSRSRYAVGIDDSGEMEYFVRFTRGANAAIGFHSIPTKDGRPLQTRAQLGTPQSHGCVRQAVPDAKQLWAFAPEGTKVVVTA